MTRRWLMCVSLGMLPTGLWGCLRPFPVDHGRVLSITRDSRVKAIEAPGTDADLHIKWLGTACHEIKLGHTSIVTDPFVTYRGLLTVAFANLRSSPRQVQRHLAPLDPPDAIFVGHAHYDHMLDLHAARRLNGWSSAKVFGSETTKNLLAGYGPDATNGVNVVQTSTDWIQLTETLSYRAFAAEHAPQTKDILLYPGFVTEPRTTPPLRAGDFKCGDTYAYLFKLKDGTGEFTVYFMGSASTPPLGFPPPEVDSVDVLMLCVPGWKNVEDYPRKIIRRLKPRQIVLSHFDNFIQPGRWPKCVVPTAHLNEFIAEALDAIDDPRFERLVVPDVGATVRVPR